VALFYRQPERFSGADQMLLAREFLERARPYAACERFHIIC
jgi:hypothetical protein